MKDLKQTVRVAVFQAAPVIMDKQATTQKVIELVMQAGEAGAELAVFPESFIPCYPRGLSFGFVVGSRSLAGREDFLRYYENSVVVAGEEIEQIALAAKKAGVYVSLGITERDAVSCTLYCTNVLIGPNGEYLGKHRKLKPTGSERTLWGEGDGSTLLAVDTPFGVMGGLICWENYMPLARVSMYAKGVSVYVAPTADSRKEWQATMKHIALEGRCFVIGCNQYVHKDMYPKDLKCYGELDLAPDEICPGGSCIIDPFGKYLAGPVYNKEQMLLAELDMRKVPMSRLDFDPCGHYSRDDVFKFEVAGQQ